MDMSVFRYVRPCCLVVIYRQFGETYLHFSSYAEYASNTFLRKWLNMYQNTRVISQTPVILIDTS
jgi:hypothetical protein